MPLTIERARCITALALRGYWRAAAGGAPIRSLREFGARLADGAVATGADRDLARSEARAYTRQSLLDAAHAAGRLYTSLLPEAYRSELGIYYTPPALSSRLLDLAIAGGADLRSARVLDPACGGGAFLAPIIERKRALWSGARSAAVLRHVAEHVRGFEIDPFAAWMSQVFADLALLELCVRTGSPSPRLVDVRDSLEPAHAARGEFDLVIGNPPYGKVKLDAERRRFYRRSLYGHANLYGVFTEFAVEACRPGGVVAFVTPTGFLGGEYFKNLRALLKLEAPPAQLAFITDREDVFDGVLQETLLAVYRRGAPASPPAVALLQAHQDRDVEQTDLGRFPLPDGDGEPWVLPRSVEQVVLVAAADRSSLRLSDLGYAVNTGPLVWNRHKSQLAEHAGPNCHPLIWAEAVTPDGRFRYQASKRNHQPYLRIRRGVDEGLLTRAPCVLVQRTTAKEQHRRLIAAPLPATFLREHGAVVVENHLNMIRPIGGNPRVGIETMAAVLNSRIVDALFRCISGSVAVSAYELESLPMPSLSALDEVALLVRRGTSGELIEQALARGYGYAGQTAAAA
jgi:adenine-specific DNA-methyltransferase